MVRAMRGICSEVYRTSASLILLLPTNVRPAVRSSTNQTRVLRTICKFSKIIYARSYHPALRQFIEDELLAHSISADRHQSKCCPKVARIIASAKLLHRPGKRSHLMFIHQLSNPLDSRVCDVLILFVIPSITENHGPPVMDDKIC